MWLHEKWTTFTLEMFKNMKQNKFEYVEVGLCALFLTSTISFDKICDKFYLCFYTK